MVEKTGVSDSHVLEMLNSLRKQVPFATATEQRRFRETCDTLCNTGCSTDSCAAN